MTIWDWIGWALVGVWFWKAWPLWYGLLQHRRLIDVPPLPADAGDAPLVSVLVPARDEAGAIEACLTQLLAMDYPNFEIIAIDDRSRDETGAIMDRFASADSRCRVLHIRELPQGWLGKNHANMLAARAARGEYLLFTDGDVLFRPQVLRHAGAFMQSRRLDHLVLFPETPSSTFWESLMMNHFIILYSMMTRFSLVRYRWARQAFVGVGAFNMVRRDAYEAIGTHERLRLEVADDLMLGKLIKHGGFTQDVLAGSELVSVKWQTGMRGIIRGLEKNAFAGARYSLAVALLGIVVQVAVVTVPFVLAITGPGRLPFALLSGLMLLTFAFVAARSRFNPLITVFFPLAGIVFAYIVARSTYITLRDGGVTWRDTFYPLAELRKGMV